MCLLLISYKKGLSTWVPADKSWNASNIKDQYTLIEHSTTLIEQSDLLATETRI